MKKAWEVFKSMVNVPLLIAIILAVVLVIYLRTTHATTLPDCEDHTDDDRIALACNIYWEARTETYEGRLAVMAVTLNRVSSPAYPDTIAEVVWQRRQFSWTIDGKPDRPQNQRSWAKALTLAERFTVSREEKVALCPTAHQIMAKHLGRPDPGCLPYQTQVRNHINIGSLVDPTGGSLFYHADYVFPYWVIAEARVRQIGRHIFYTAARVRR